ncbi:hypothetical protein AAHA92_10294 [Salvia divinorum]|uniref:Uncharacterized protein n=2 Tax=Salvia divinorum TaxID=28513 RepID=A0ABD1HV29_SALDI
MKMAKPWQGSDVPSSVALEAGCVIEKEMGIGFTPLELNQRLLNLQQRYLTFKHVVSWPGACWVASMHIVVAVDDVWKEIFKAHSLASAYYHEDEPEFHRLAVIFGWDAVKEEDRVETILLFESVCEVKKEARTKIILLTDSVDRAENEGRNAQTILVSDSADECSTQGGDEVNSPMPPVVSTIRRKLFIQDEGSLD